MDNKKVKIFAALVIAGFLVAGPSAAWAAQWYTTIPKPGQPTMPTPLEGQAVTTPKDFESLNIPAEDAVPAGEAGAVDSPVQVDPASEDAVDSGTEVVTEPATSGKTGRTALIIIIILVSVGIGVGFWYNSQSIGAQKSKKYDDKEL